MIFRFIIFLIFVFSAFSPVFSIENFISQNIVGYVSHEERSKTIAVKMRDVMGVQEGFSLSQVVTETSIPGVFLPGTQACFFDGDDWVHVEQLICDGELHWCKWIDKGTAEIVDDLIVPFGSAFSYALPEGVSKLVFSGEFFEEEFPVPELDFVDDETYDNIRKVLIEMSSAPVQKRVVLADKDVMVEARQISDTQSVSVTNYVTCYVTNYVEELKNRFLVRHNSGKVESAIYSLKLNRACDPDTGYPLDIDVNKVVFIEDKSIPEEQRASEVYCHRFYNLIKGDFSVLQTDKTAANETASNNRISESWFSGWFNKICDFLFNKVLDRIWWLLVIGVGVCWKKTRGLVMSYFRRIKKILRIRAKD